MSEGFKLDLGQHVRDEECARRVVPWLNRCMPLAGRRMIGIGCGTGSSTAAFGLAIGSEGFIDAYDVNAPSVDAARARTEIFGLSNACFHVVQPETLTHEMRANNPEEVGIVLCCAGLEHQTLDERLDTLRTSWEVLRPSEGPVCCRRFAEPPYVAGLALIDAPVHRLPSR